MTLGSILGSAVGLSAPLLIAFSLPGAMDPRNAFGEALIWVCPTAAVGGLLLSFPAAIHGRTAWPVLLAIGSVLVSAVSLSSALRAGT
jgi:hypothetical protein